MIPSLLLAWMGLGLAQEAAEPEPDPLAPYRVPFTELTERTIGMASKPVAFNWRSTRVHLAATGGLPFELNTFRSARVGGMARVPVGRALVEVGATWVQVWDSAASRQLALTPYRQAGRPSRVEVDLGVAWPLAEGVVTASPKFFPSTQLVLNLHGNLRYLVHPTAWGGLRPGQVVGALFAPQLSQREIDNLDQARLDAMRTDPARYGLMVGLGNDLYFAQGVFVSPRAMVAVPLLAPLTGSQLGWWAELSLSVGIAL